MSKWTNLRDGFTHYVAPIGAGIGAGVLTGNPAIGFAVGSGLLGAAQAHQAQKSQAVANAENWQHQQELASLAYLHDKEMADYNNEWNSYANQAQLMQAAGLNPAVMFGEGNLTNGSNAGASSIPNPSPMSPLFDSDLINAQNNMVSNLIDAGIQVAKTPKELNKMDAEIQDLLANAKNKDAATAYQELQTQLDQAFAGLERQKGLDKIAADIKYTIAKEMLTLKQGELVDEQKVNTWMDTLLKRSQKLLNEKNYQMLVEQAPIILQNLIRTGKQIEATTNNIETNTALAPYNAETNRISANAAMIGANASMYMAQHPQTWDGALTRVINGFFGGKTFEEIGMEIRSWFVDQNVPKNIVDEFLDNLGNMYKKMGKPLQNYNQRGKDNYQRQKLRSNGRKVGSTHTTRW